MTRSRRVALWVTLALLGACAGSSDVAGDPDGAAAGDVTALMVGAEGTLPAGDVEAVVATSVRAVAMAETLEAYWAAVGSDPDVASDASRQLGEQVRAMERDLDTATVAAVREHYRPYVARWYTVARAVARHLRASTAGDGGSAEAAASSYGEAIAAVSRLDGERLGRVTAVLGPEEGRRALERVGVPVLGDRA